MKQITREQVTQLNKTQLAELGFTLKKVRGTKGRRNTLKGTRYVGKTNNLR